MPYSDAQKRASKKWRAANQVQLNLRMRPEEKELIAAGAESAGLSIAKYLISLAERDQHK